MKDYCIVKKQNSFHRTLQLEKEKNTIFVIGKQTYVLKTGMFLETIF